MRAFSGYGSRREGLMTDKSVWTEATQRSGDDRNDDRGNDRGDDAGAGRGDGGGAGRGDERRNDRGNDRDPLGSAAEEAFKLFDAIQQKATRELRRNLIKSTVSGVGGAFSGSFSNGGRSSQDVWGEAVSEHDEYICRACPVCRAMAAQRESGGVVTDHLMQAGSELFAAFRSVVDGLNKPSPGQRARERDRAETPVEHIDLG